jgi:Uri superfamily endonuclease
LRVDSRKPFLFFLLSTETGVQTVASFRKLAFGQKECVPGSGRRGCRAWGEGSTAGWRPGLATRLTRCRQLENILYSCATGTEVKAARQDANTGGTYLLLLQADSPRRVNVGRLGVVEVRPGYYVYAGSAWGPGGLEARIARHRRTRKKLHWHIDYLRRWMRVVDVVQGPGLRCEHEWAARVGAWPGAQVVLAGFGSSDCDCPTHLYWFAARPDCKAV